MASELADLVVTLRAEVAPLLTGVRSAATEGEAAATRPRSRTGGPTTAPR
ncbi:hypothetical protein [Streptomyces sp. NPDC052036]